MTESEGVGLDMLRGVRVADFTQALSGPFCTMMLADLGAEVIKIEDPRQGDDSRNWGPPFIGEDAAYFMSVNRNKRSVALDLKNSEDFEGARRIVAASDVVVENWRPGTATRLGLSAEALRAHDPRLIYCSISGFGQDQGTRSGYDQIVQGTTGVMSLTGPPGAPTKWGVPIGDVASGMFAATAIVSALFERSHTGVGRTIDIAMQDSLVSMLTHHAARYLATEVVPESDHNGHASISPYGLFSTKDGNVNLCVGNDSQFQRLCEAFGNPNLAFEPRFSTNRRRVENRMALFSELNETLLEWTSDEVIDALEVVGVPAGKVLHLGEVLEDPATLARGMILSFIRPDSGVTRVINTPWKFDGVPPAVNLAPPMLGQHTDEVLNEIGRLDS